MNIQTINFQGLFFVNVTKPTDFEMKFLRNTYDFDSLDLEDYLHRTQIPKIENHKKYDLLVLRFPIFSENSQEATDLYGTHLLPLPVRAQPKRRLTSGYVDFFISEQQVVVLHEGILPQIDHIFGICQKTLHNRIEYMGKRATFLAYKIIDALVDSCFPVINTITSRIDQVDKELEVKQSSKTLEEISTIRRNLVVFHTMIKPIVPLLEELRDGKHATLNGPMRPYWSNILDHVRKILDRVEDNQELIEGISESNESFLMTQTNLTIRLLTVITVILMPIQILGGIYGMNIDGLPYAHVPYAFPIHLLMIFIIALPLIITFKLKRWI
jgi:magnesium transporter